MDGSPMMLRIAYMLPEQQAEYYSVFSEPGVSREDPLAGYFADRRLCWSDTAKLSMLRRGG